MMVHREFVLLLIIPVFPDNPSVVLAGSSSGSLAEPSSNGSLRYACLGSNVSTLHALLYQLVTSLSLSRTEEGAPFYS
jgi:hypothetical protein